MFEDITLKDIILTSAGIFGSGLFSIFLENRFNITGRIKKLKARICREESPFELITEFDCTGNSIDDFKKELERAFVEQGYGIYDKISKDEKTFFSVKAGKNKFKIGISGINPVIVSLDPGSTILKYIPRRLDEWDMIINKIHKRFNPIEFSFDIELPYTADIHIHPPKDMKLVKYNVEYNHGRNGETHVIASLSPKSNECNKIHAGSKELTPLRICFESFL